MTRAPPALRRARFPAPVIAVLRRLLEAGHRSWIVGGAVRDHLRGRARGAGDHDLATPARPEEVMKLFRRVLPTGIEHGTVTVLEGGTALEVTTFRGEGAYADGRRPSSVTFHGDLTADLARRDFTVTALAFDPLSGAFEDPFDGRSDLRRGILRAVGDPAARFREDGLRPLRAARFASQLGFALEARTVAAIPGALDVARRVSAERVAQELSKLLLGRHVRHGLDVLEATGLLQVALPEVAELDAAPRAHALAAAAWADGPLAVRLAALLHPAGGGNAAAAARRAGGALDRLRFSGAIRETVSFLVSAHDCPLDPGARLPVAAAAARRWLARSGRTRAPLLVALWRADALAVRPLASSRTLRRRLRRFQALLASVDRDRPPIATSDLAIDGAAVMARLGVRGGPVVGEALRHLLDLVLEEPAHNHPERLLAELDGWASRLQRR